MSDKRQCKAIKAGGGRCSNRARPEQEYCWSHSPETVKQRREYARAGGKARSRRVPDELEQVKRQLRTITGGVLQGSIDRGTGAVLFQGYNVLLRSIELQRKLDSHRELEEQIAELRGRLMEVKRKQWAG